MQAKVIELRQLLAERFPALRGPGETSPGVGVPTGWPQLDRVLGGGWPRGELSEMVASGQGTGSAQWLHAWLRHAAVSGQYLALIDGADSFDAGVEVPEVLSRLLWVRCRQASEAIQVADLLLRDRNFPLVAIDLKFNPVSELRRISATVWHRFQRLLEQSGSTAVVITPQALVTAAACRVQVEGELSLADLQAGTLPFSRLRAKVLRQAGMETGLAEVG